MNRTTQTKLQRQPSVRNEKMDVLPEGSSFKADDYIVKLNYSAVWGRNAVDRRKLFPIICSGCGENYRCTYTRKATHGLMANDVSPDSKTGMPSQCWRTVLAKVRNGSRRMRRPRHTATEVGSRQCGAPEVYSHVQEVEQPAVACRCDKAQFEWNFGEIASYQDTMAEAIALAKELNDMDGLAEALFLERVSGSVPAC
jgi:hypothetical protein